MDAIAQKPVFASVKLKEKISMTALIPCPERSLMSPSVPDLATIYHFPFEIAYWMSVRKDFLPEIKDVYCCIEYMHRSALDKVRPRLPGEDVAALMNKSFYTAVRKQVLEQQQADENDATLVVKALLSTLPLNKNIDPHALAETYMEIIRECLPSKLALSFARIHLRNTMTFAPTGKEFRDTLINAIRSLRELREAIMSLDDIAERTNNFEMGYPDEAKLHISESNQELQEAGDTL
jgi:mRNA-degrading endonuclease YafQ of YafQ-DinJ toxin-antitoxin module